MTTRSAGLPHFTGLSRPAVILAPMAGITDLPFRRVAAGFGADLVVSEMVASRDALAGRREMAARAALDLRAGLCAVQLAGREPYWMAEAARLVADAGASLVDINMGCPAKKVTGGQAGAALMREPERALAVIESVVSAVDVPVTVKMRLGWDVAQPSAAPLARQAAEAGAAMVAVHGRSRCQFYRGRADWAAVAPVAAAAGVPVAVNGDIDDPATARTALAASGAAAVMVGRAARGAPWRLASIAAALSGRAAPPQPRGGALADLVSGHHEAMLHFYGTELGLRVARKHLAWYMDDAGTPDALRREILTAGSPAAVARCLPLAFDRMPAEAAA